MNLKQFINEAVIQHLNEFDDDRKFLSGKDLPKIQEYLKSIGLDLVNYDLDNETNIAGNPLVRNGQCGIRATYIKRKDQLSIWFTNNFADKDNEIRQKVEKFIETLM